MTHCKNLLPGLLLVCTVMVGALTLALFPATAHAGMKATLSCPITSTPGAMVNLGLTLTKEKHSPFSTTITKTAVAIHLGNLHIIGPITIPISVTLADDTPDNPPCGGLGEPSCIYQATATIPNYLSAPFPQVSRGTLSSLGVAVMDDANKPIAEGWCNIEVQ